MLRRSRRSDTFYASDDPCVGDCDKRILFCLQGRFVLTVVGITVQYRARIMRVTRGDMGRGAVEAAQASKQASKQASIQASKQASLLEAAHSRRSGKWDLDGFGTEESM